MMPAPIARIGAATEGDAPSGPAGGAADAVSVGGRAAVDVRSAPDVLDARRYRPASCPRSCAHSLPASPTAWPSSIADIDPLITEAAEHWRLERMNVMDRLILRLATYEFLHEADTPGKVIINEALELARTFSGDDAVRFINGILDAIRKKLERE